MIRFTILIFIVFTQSLIAQNTLIGGKLINNEKEPIIGAYVTVSKSYNGAILIFSQTDNKGNFKLNNIPKTDTVWVSVNYLGYEKLSLKISTKIDFIELKLTKSANELEEVIVRPPIIKRNDTLSYKVEAFQKLGDRTLADVINRIPGLEVDLSGKITFQGNQIEKFYVEGMDLMGGRYGMINNNLLAEKVDRVEVLENHQSIKMLEKISMSNKASINIKLKNKYTALIPVAVGIGGGNLQYDVNLTPMLFSPKNQFLGSFQADNSGKNIGLPLRDHSTVSISNLKESMVDIQNAPTPIFEGKRWRFNTSLLGSLNYLRRTKKQLDVKANFAGLYDRVGQEYTNQTEFLLPGNQSVFLSEMTKNKLTKRPVSVSLNISQNLSHFFIKNNLELHTARNRNLGDLKRNDDRIYQIADIPETNLKNDFVAMLKWGRRIVNISSELRYENALQNLTLHANNRSFNFNPSGQTAHKKNILINGSAGMLFIVKGMTLSSKVTIQHEDKKFNSELISLDSLFDNYDYLNQLELKRTFVLSENSLEAKITKWVLKAELPVHVQRIRYLDLHFGKDNILQNIPIEPQLTVRYAHNNNLKFSFSGRYLRRFGDIGNIHYGFFMPNYRTLNKRDYPLPETKTIRNSASIQYHNPFTKITGNISGSVGFSENNLLFDRTILNDGSSIITAQNIWNRSTEQTLTGGIGYTIPKIDIKIRYKGNLSAIERPLLVNDIQTKVNSSNFSNSILFDYFHRDRISINGETSIISFRSRMNRNEKVPPLENVRYVLGAKLSISKEQLLWVESQYYSSKSIKNSAFFLDAGYRISFRRKKVDLGFTCQNILNKTLFFYASLDATENSGQIFHLRPFQVLATTKWTINTK